MKNLNKRNDFKKGKTFLNKKVFSLNNSLEITENLTSSMKKNILDFSCDLMKIFFVQKFQVKITVISCQKNFSAFF